MKITKNKLFAVVITVLVAVAAAIWYFGVFSIKPEKTTSNAENTKSSQQAVTTEKTTDSKYATLKGDAFDEAFIADMIAHNEAAINMSEQAQAMTARDEIRTLASTIMETQTTEMVQMREWQQAWGFEITNSGGHMSHGGGGAEMAGDMVEMQNKLNDLKGEAYDKEFLKQMILHHEQAVDMAKYAADNAKRQEIKDLASSIIKAQNEEIRQMKQWQESWGY